MSRLAAALAQLRALDAPTAPPAARALPDARALLLTTLAFGVAVLSFPRTAPAALLPMALYPLWLIARGGMPWSLLGRGLVVAAPLVLLAGLVEPWIGRHGPVAVGPWTIDGGWLVLAALLLRCLLLVSAVLALVAALGLREVCAALAALGVPRAFAEQLLLLHRHLFVLLEEGQRITTAWRLRAGRRRHLPWSTYGALAGQWLVRSVQRAQRVHQAMLARGWKGALPQRAWPRWRRADLGLLVGWIAYFVLMRTIDGPLALGRWLLGS